MSAKCHNSIMPFHIKPFTFNIKLLARNISKNLIFKKTKQKNSLFTFFLSQ